MKNVFRTLIIFALSLLLCVSALAETVTINGSDYIPRQNLFTTLILGIDESGEIEPDTRHCGSIFLVVTDKAEDTYAVIALDRDTYCGAGASLMDLYQCGTDETIQAISELLGGIRIDCYAVVDIGAVSIINDSIGGATVTMTQDMTAIDPAMAEGTTLCLTGEQALAFVREVVSTNRERMERQQQFLTAIKPYFAAACEADPSFFTELAESAADYIDTDMTDKEFSYLAKALTQNTSLGFYTLEGSFENDFFYPDEDDVTGLVTMLFYHPAY